MNAVYLYRWYRDKVDKSSKLNRKNIMDKKQQDIAYFISFCIEQYKNAKGLSGEEVMQEFSKYGVLRYGLDVC